MAFDLKGKVAAVTGGSSGIGAATVAALQAKGAKVAVLDINPPADGAGDLYVHCDVTDLGSMEKAVAEVVDKLGDIAVLHLNAGLMTRPADASMADDPIDLINGEGANRLFNINVQGPLLGLKAATPSLTNAGGASVVVTASIAGLSGQAFDPFYSMSKHAMIGLVRSFAPVLAPRGININAICPGGVQTPIVPEEMAEMAASFMQPSTMADAIVEIIEGDGTGGIWVKNTDEQPLVDTDADGDPLTQLFS